MDLTGEENPPVLETMMGDREWLAGDTRTIAGAYFIGIALGAFRCSTGAETIDQRDYPRLYRHVQKLEADPAVVFAHAIEDERPAVSSGGFKGRVSLEDLKVRLPRRLRNQRQSENSTKLHAVIGGEGGRIVVRWGSAEEICILKHGA